MFQGTSRRSWRGSAAANSSFDVMPKMTLLFATASIRGLSYCNPRPPGCRLNAFAPARKRAFNSHSRRLRCSAVKERDLLANSVVTPLQEHYLIAGAVCSVSTNSELILDAARDSFGVPVNDDAAVDARMRLWVDASARSQPPWPAAHFRGMDHLVFAGFDSGNTVLVDLRRRRAVGRLSPAMAADRGYLRRVVFPTLFGIFTDVIAVTPMHCACVERDGRGLLLTGASGSGKSTLSLALSREGFDFLSDEWTYFSWREGRLLAWGLPSLLKLLPDARRHFPELAPIPPALALNGEVAYEVEPESVFGIRRSDRARPNWLVFLERHEAPVFSISQVSPTEAAAEFAEHVEYYAMHGLSEGRDLLEKTIQGLGRISCWRLQHGGHPANVARALAEFLERKDVRGRSEVVFRRAEG